MSYLNALLTDLRDRKLWPVPLVLIAALVAVPVLLSKSPATPQATPSPGLGIASQTANAVTVDATPVQAPLAAGTRDPFTQQKLASATTAKAAAVSSGVTASGSTGGASVATGSNSTGGSTASIGAGSTGSSSGNSYYSGGGSSTGTSTGTGSTGSGSPVTTRPPAPTGLSATEAYHVSVSITDQSGGVNPIDPFQRDGTLPSDQQPLLVELGVAQGAQRVLFAVQPGSVVSGPGTCTPGPLDCEVLSLAAGQTEAISKQSANGAVPVAMFQITGISVDRFGSKAAASQARASTDRVGSNLLANSASSTLSLFQYDPSLDAVVDERNLTVGGN